MRRNKPPVDRRQRERLECVERFLRPFDRGRRGHQHQVLDPNAVGASLVIARLVREDHAALQWNGAELGQPRRAFMHGEIAADAMAGAVIEIEAGGPEELPRQRVELRARRALGKYCARDRDMTLEHERETLAHLLARRADGDRARDVGRAILVLGAGIEQE